MNHKAIITSISFLIIATVVSGILYLQWQKRPRGVVSSSHHASSTATNSLLGSTPKPVLGPSPAETAPTQGTLRPPRVVEHLCSNSSEQRLVTQDGEQLTFRKNAASIQRCDAGKVWAAGEDGAKVPDVATFYFDENGILLDICQALFWRSGCTRFEHISCEQRNYCEE